MSLYLGTNLISGVATPIEGARNIGQIVQSTIPLTDAGLHLLDGSLISGSGSYADFVTYIAGFVSSYPNLFDTEANWQSAVTTYGVCGKFVYDSVNNTVRLPKYSDKIYTGGGTAPVAGNGKGLGLTDGTLSGCFGNYNAGYNASYYNATLGSDVGSSYSPIAPAGTKVIGVVTDATKSGLIAQLSNITTSVDGYYYIVVATSTKTDIQVDIDEIATDLNGKADVDLSNCTKPHIVETYVNGTSWYRIYSDGWCEQGGYYANSSSSTKSFTFLKPFSNNNYYLSSSATYISNGGTDHQESMSEFVSRNANGFTKYIWKSTNNFYWKACGYIN